MTSANTNPPTDDDRYERIWAIVSDIPAACVLNYGEVARLAGLPGRARMVGRALARAPARLKLPWHRVVNSRGEISFRPDSSRHQRQRELLEAEGVEFENNIIDLERHAPSSVLDRMLWGP